MIKINGEVVENGIFPDGTPCVRHGSLADGKIVFEWYFDDMSELFILQCLRDKFSGDADLLLPYIPNARMDRIKNDVDVFTLKTFCRIINGMKFSNVYVNNAHSNVSLALLDNVHDMIGETLTAFFADVVEKLGVDTVMFPDEGACKRYSDFDIVKKYGIVTGMKKRDWKTGAILGLDILGNADDVRGKKVLIVDDICSRGGTFKFSAIKLREMGAEEVYLYVSHCENVVDWKSLKDAGIKKVFTTSSIFREKKWPLEKSENPVMSGFIQIVG